MKVLELTGIQRSHARGVPVLAGVDLALEAGEVVGLVGENGAGKTTLLRIALGSLVPQRGTVRLFGLDPRAEPVEVKRRLGYVAEDQVLPPYLRVAQVLDLHRSLYPSWDDALAGELVTRFALDGRARIQTLSKGQARRVAVVCAVAHRPELLLLDEPAGGFDPAARREVLDVVLQLLSEAGTAILFSSHHMQDLERSASRVALLHHGTLLFDRELDALREETTLVVLPGGNGFAPGDLRRIEGCLASRVVADELRAVFVGEPEAVRTRLAPHTRGHAPQCATLPLEELMVEILGERT